MADRQLGQSDSAGGKPILVPSSSETAPSGQTELQPYSLSRISSPSNQSSIMVPVRLDVLLFLLNSAARGAQYAVPPISIQSAPGPASACPPGPVAQHVPNCCGCLSAGHSVYQPCGTHQYRGGHGGHGGVAESRDNRHGRDVGSHHDYGNYSSASSSTGSWKRPQGWQEKPQGEGRGWDDRNNWQGRRQNFGRSWGDQRHTTGDSSLWNASMQGSKKGSAFGSNYTNNKRAPEGSLRPPWDALDAKRPASNTRVDWRKGQGTKETASFQDKPVDNSLCKPAVGENEEDWETDYESGQTSTAAPGAASSSHSDDPLKISKEEGCASTDDPPKLRLLTSPLPELASKTQAVAAVEPKPPVASGADQSKNGGFVNYLKNLYSDLPKKTASEGSSDLVIDMDVESSKPGEEEQSPKNDAGEESKSWE